MKSFSTLLLLSFLVFFGGPSAAQTWNWGKMPFCGGAPAEGWTVTTDVAGNVYEAGEMFNSYGLSSYVAFGSDTAACNGVQQIFLFSTDSAGNYRWAITSRVQAAIINGLATDSFGHVYVYGTFYNESLSGIPDHPFYFGDDSLNVVMHWYNPQPNYFLAKVDSNGHVMWLKDLPNQYNEYFGNTGSISIDSRNNLYVSGVFSDSLITIDTATRANKDLSHTSSDIFLAKLDSSGRLQWLRTFGGDSSDFVLAQATTRNGDTYMAGYFESDSIPFGSGMLRFPSGLPLPRNLNAGAFVVKFDPFGNEMWSTVSPGANIPTIAQMATDNTDNAYLVGGAGMGGFTFGSVSTYHNFIIKFTPDGVAAWGASMSDPADFINYGVSIDNCNNIWVTGGQEGLSWGSPDPMIIGEFNTSGTNIYMTSVPSGGDDICGIAADNFGHVYLSGDVAYPMTIGPDVLTPVGYEAEWFFLLSMSYPFTACVPPPLPTLGLSPVAPVQEGVCIFPNPAGDECTISVSLPLSPASVMGVYDMTGRLMESTRLQGPLTTFSTAGLPVGVYQCKIQINEKTSLTRKLSVIR